jgi:protein TonB
MDRRNFTRYLAPGIAGVIAVAGLALFVHYMTSQPKDTKTKRETPQIVQIVRPPPPPPDEPPPPPPPPEEEIEEPLPQDTPDPEPADEAPAEQLGLDADGVAGGDGFGLAARRGGSDITGTGGAAFAWYTSMLKETILDRLGEDERVRKGNYRVTVRVWLAEDGRVERAQLADSTGNREVDAAIEQSLERLGRLKEAPPIEMPQPITLRIVSRG